MLLQLGREKLHVSAFLYSLSLMIISHSPLCLVADNDECTVRHQTCPSTSVCRNTDGSFVCDCPVGYTGDGRTGCTVTGNCAICTGYLTDCSQEYAVGLERTMTLVTFYPWSLCQVVAYRMRWINHCTSKFAKLVSLLVYAFPSAIVCGYLCIVSPNLQVLQLSAVHVPFHQPMAMFPVVISISVVS